MWILAGDIGGTNTRLALVDAAEPRSPRRLRVYRSADHESLEAIAADYLAAGRREGEPAPTRAGFGIAGPVDGAIVTLTNLPWVVDKARLAAALGVERVAFVNDFAAISLAVPALRAADLHAIGPGEPRAHEPIAVLGAGTGLGESFLVWCGSEYRVVPSEGGHADFAPRTALEMRLLAFMLERHERVSVERLVSGPGLVNLYRFFHQREGLPEAPAVKAELAREEAPAVIARHGLAGDDPLCGRALDLFCELYGAEAGNLALKVLARGGVYLAGGIAGKILPRLEAGGFRHAFERKGRYAEFLRGVPTLLVTYPQPGLLGAALAALRE
ncbi:MAG: glucokinase [Candidatus Lambdaproteobacteria bacterium]|nr:glucokinase [Candidatus Lambdaproteobacteria bacterium]